ncbi:unnamed protein product [Brassicogethes aeneus]|uniref:Uncharacterized protein n=1 Tax=Brassicogethes aeneus TaxID=1431903 RepID=A0A9P0B8C3_BRAAE|nr:unnamed protein product [Brassicogethes aeneus]
MASKFIVLAALVAVVRGGVVSAPVGVAAKISDATFDPNPQYSFAYDVQDALTGDSKSQVESRSGNIVQGQYSLVEPDGTRRIVDYVADPINGFNAIVRKEPLVVAAPAKILARAPVASKLVAEPVVARAVAKAGPVVAKAVSRSSKQVAAQAVPFAASSAQLISAPSPIVAQAAPAVARLAAPYVAAPAPLAYPAFSLNYPFAGPLTYAYV